jgi:hypothetical protein
MAIKKIFKVLLILIIVFILSVVVLSVYFLANSKTILSSELKKKLGAEVSLSGLRVVWPGALVIDDFSISKSLTVKKIKIVPSILGFLHGDIVFNYILLEEPQGTITRLPDGVFDFGITLPKKEVVPVTERVEGQKASGGSKNPKFYFNKLKIRQATLVFIDQATPSKEEFRATFAKLDLDIHHPFVLNLSRFHFDGRGVLEAKDRTQAGTLKLSGWIDILPRDMDGIVRIEISSMPLFSPYYKKYVKKEVKSGRAVVSADLKSKANDLTADCHVELGDIVFKEEPQSAEGEEAVQEKSSFSGFTFGSMFGAGGSTIFDFIIRTKLNHPKFERISLKGNFLQSTVNAVLSQPLPKNAEDFKKIGEQFESIGKEFKKVFKSE